MNALVSIDKLLLSPAEDMRATTLFGTGQIDTILAAIEKDVRSELYDIETKDGRERIKSVAYAIARSKTTLDEIGKEHVAHIKVQSAAIDKERKTLRDRLDALKDEIRKPVTDWETAEASRVADHEAALVSIMEAPTVAANFSAHDLIAYKARLEELAGRDWQEFGERAVAAFAEIMPKICAMRDVAEQRERDAAELEALRREKAERDAKDAERERAEAIRLEAERKAEAERIREEQRKKDQEAAVARAIEQERMRAERDKAAAIEAERRRQEQEARDAAAKKAAEDAAEKKRQENKRHRAKIRKEIETALGTFLMHDAPEEDGDCDGLVSAIVDHIEAGRIPHVSINY